MSELNERKQTIQPSLWQFLLYFLRLGTLGFGGPIALVGNMHRDLVEERKWISQEDYAEGLTLAQLAPGPLAAQLAIYLGYLRGRVPGASLVAVVFILPSFLMVLAIAIPYQHYGGLPIIHALFYGIGAAVIGIITRSSIKLIKSSLGRDRLLWGIFLALAVTTAVTQREIISLLLLGGIIPLFLELRRRGSVLRPRSLAGLALVIAPAPLNGTLLSVLWFFSKAGLFVFGSGLAIVPFLYGGVVQEHHWLTDRQFIDAVAVAMITPGPVVITAGFVGYLVAGIWGSIAAALGVFLPVYLIVVLVAPHYKRLSSNALLAAFAKGVTAAAVGAIAGAVVVLAQRSLHDATSTGIALATFLLLTRWKIPEPLTILGAALLGLALYRG